MSTRLSPNLRTLLLGLSSIGVASGLAFAASGSGASASAPAPARVSPVAEVAPPEAPLPTELPTWASSFPGDERVTDAQRDAIQNEARTLAKTLPAGSPLRAQLFARLTDAPRCGRAHAAAVAGTFSESSPAEIEGALASMKTSCDEVIVEAAGFSQAAEPTLVSALERLTAGHREEASRRAAWLAYGSLGETARRTGKPELASVIDGKLEKSLGVKSGDRALLVKAVGNAGCASCMPLLAGDMRSSDVGLRSAAVAAHRFVDDKSGVQAMCGALAADKDDAVRDMAAWALEWRGGEATERAACLERAARVDPSKRVRMQATLALGVLADDAAPARAALERLADDERLDVSSLAGRSLEMRGMTPAPLLAALEPAAGVGPTLLDTSAGD
ncbi:MAG: HEAT repeat domain-containing protein [Myxococcales bacterium]|nr:HEAT repeat domain-containing protein [Myxococcales bacterium]